MVFSEYMQGLPNQQQETIKEIAELTYSSTMSVYRWMSGKSRPPLIKQKVIAEYLKMDIQELFPTPEEKGGEL